jgi:hypothetical protein
MDTQNIHDFLLDCVLDLYSIDSIASYQHAYHYVREISVQLRNVYLLNAEGKSRSNEFYLIFFFSHIQFFLFSFSFI